MSVTRVIFALVGPALIAAGPPSVPGSLDTGAALFGYIDEDFVARFDQAAAKYPELKIGSVGGKPIDGLSVAKTIEERKTRIAIYGVCLSSCSEFILPAASTFSWLKLVKDPIIGFHHNVLVIKYAFEQIGRRDYQVCFSEIDRQFVNFRRKTGVPPESIQFQIDKIGLHAKETPLTSACAEAKVVYDNKFWFPNSQQLRDTWHLTFEGSVCADTRACMEARLPRLGREGDQYVIGEELFRLEQLKGALSLVKLRSHQP